MLGQKVVKAFTNEEAENKKFEKDNGQFLDIKKETYRYMAAFQATTKMFDGIMYLTVLVAGGIFMVKGMIAPGDLVAYMLYVTPMIATIRRIIEFAEQFQRGMTGIERFLQIMEADIEIFDETDAVELLETQGNIVFENVSFEYPDDHNIVFTGLDLNIRHGEKVAIVGENGSGKTTFINLLLGLYAPQEGTIMIGNLPLAEHVRSCRKNMSAIFQNFGKYEATIRQNIVISDLDRPEDDRGLLELMEKAGAGALLENQENGLDEMVGSLSDQGNNLSGGQWQRLAITRAAYRENAKIMILDEPTAALDPLTEAELYRNFAKIVAGRTTLFVSHRLGVSKIVDRILVFQDGRIAEDGSHEELMRKNGLYAKMYHAQAQWYN